MGNSVLVNPHGMETHGLPETLNGERACLIYSFSIFSTFIFFPDAVLVDSSQWNVQQLFFSFSDIKEKVRTILTTEQFLSLINENLLFYINMKIIKIVFIDHKLRKSCDLSKYI